MIQNITMAEVLKKKDELRNSITADIAVFEQSTGAKVSEINIYRDINQKPDLEFEIKI